jgi:hypothetical protein
MPVRMPIRLNLNLNDTLKLELELIQAYMAQKPLLWVEVGTHATAKTHSSNIF